MYVEGKRLILETTPDGGTIWIYEEELTPEFLDKIKKDKSDKMGWKKYHKKLKEKGYDV